MMQQGYDWSSFRNETEELIPRLDYGNFTDQWSDYFDVSIRRFDKVKTVLFSDLESIAGIDNLIHSEGRNVSLGEYRRDHPPLLQRIRQLIRPSDKKWFSDRAEKMRQRVTKQRLSLTDHNLFGILL